MMSRHNQNALERQVPLSRREILAAASPGAAYLRTTRQREPVKSGRGQDT